MNILGISAYYHDAAAALITDGKIIAAAQEERFTRIKNDSNFPIRAVSFCLNEAEICIDDIDCLVFYDKPILKFDRILESYLDSVPKGLKSFCRVMPAWLSNKLHLPKIIRRETGYTGKILFTEHHEAHAASAFFPSPFSEAAVICFDGVGEWATTSWGIGSGNEVQLKEQIKFPHSLGLLYSAFTYYTGFKVNSGEYKLMGLAPYGMPRYVDVIRKELIDIKNDGSFQMNMKYFSFCHGMTMTNDSFNKLFEGPPRKPESELTQKVMDIAASIQAVTDEIVIKIARYVQGLTGIQNLCLAGGVALNCVSNGKLHREKIFQNIWIQPAAGDAGGALGAALAIHHHYLEQPRNANAWEDSQSGSYLGPSYSRETIRKYLVTNNYPHKEMDEHDLLDEVAERIAAGSVIGWFQGRMEFGPRALGARSIIGDARNPAMQKLMNLKIKHRESFRPFAPSVLREHVSAWFDFDGDSPYMLMVAPVAEDKLLPVSNELKGFERINLPRSLVPAITHVDNSARIQTVDGTYAPRFRQLIHRFHEKTGCPVIINTSFNVRGEPIVCAPEDAYRCFMRTDLDLLVLENFILEKNSQPAWNEHNDWKNSMHLD